MGRLVWLLMLGILSSKVRFCYTSIEAQWKMYDNGKKCEFEISLFSAMKWKEYRKGKVYNIWLSIRIAGCCYVSTAMNEKIIWNPHVFQQAVGAQSDCESEGKILSHCFNSKWTLVSNLCVDPETLVIRISLHKKWSSKTFCNHTNTM